MQGREEHPGMEHRARERWRAARWPLLSVAALAALALGAIGFGRHLRALGESRPASDLLYLSLQLFTLESGSLRGPLPWQLELARFLAPALAVYTAVQALAVVFRQQIQALRVRRMRRHVVVCGLGRKGLLLARRYREAGERVVAIERDGDNLGMAPARDAGVEVLLGDATELSVLRRAAVARARQLVAVCGSDGDNAAIAVAARALVADRGGPPLVAVVHLLDEELCALLRERELMRGAPGGFRLEFFNVFETGAEAMLEEIPWRADSSPHVVLVGLGHLGGTLLRRLLRGRPAGAAASLRVTVIDHDAGRLARARDVCGAGAGCELSTYELDVRSPAFAAARFALDSAGHPTASGVYVCLDDDGAALAAALALHRRLAGEGIPIAVRMEEESGLATLLGPGDAARGSFGDLRGFGLLERTCRPERLLAVSRERLAQAIHQGYVTGQLAAGSQPDGNPALVPWARLSEELRESNRAQADDIGRKLALIGCEIRAVAALDSESFAFAAGEIERLAELEHQRWITERTTEGWTFASGEKNLERKRSPYLVPWCELDEATREIDRQTVRGLPVFLAGIGFAIRRVDGARRRGRAA